MLFGLVIADSAASGLELNEKDERPGFSSADEHLIRRASARRVCVLAMGQAERIAVLANRFFDFRFERIRFVEEPRQLWCAQWFARERRRY
jgi:hypothetical protein